MGDNSQAAEAVTTAANALVRTMESVGESPSKLVAAEATDDKASRTYTEMDYLLYSGRFSPTARELAQRLGRNFSPDARDENGWTDLHYAAALNLPGLASALLDAGAEPDAAVASDEQEWSGDLLATLSTYGLDVDGLPRSGWTPLHVGGWFNATLAAPHLITAGGDVDIRADRFRSTPLHAAARADSRAVAEFLIGRDADVQATTSYGWTPLDHAIEGEASETQELLRRHGGLCNEKC